MITVILFIASVVIGWSAYASGHVAGDFWTIDRRISCCFIYMAVAFSAMAMFSFWSAVRRIARAIPPIDEG
jgi:hypothetical protein